MTKGNAQLVATLGEFDAPADVARHAAGYDSFEAAWESEVAADIRVWLGAVAGLSLESIAEAAAAALFAFAEEDQVAERLARWVEACVSAADASACAEHAERCEREGTSNAPYRDSTRYAAIAHAASLICRAFESLRSADLLMESQRLAQARNTAAYLGGGVAAFLPANPGAATLLATPPQSAERGLLVMACASAAQALTELRELTSAPDRIDEVVWDTLAPE